MPDIRVGFDADEQVTNIDASVSGPESATLTEADFTENARADGTYRYTTTVTVSSSGDYDLSLTTAEDSGGNPAVQLPPTKTVSVSAGTVVESFEDNDMTEYSAVRGAVSDWTVQTGTVVDGTYALESPTSSSNGFPNIISTSGLNAYPSSGDTFEFRAYFTDSTTEARSLEFGVQDGDNHYSVQFGLNSNLLKLVEIVSGSGTDLDSDTSVSYPVNEWLTCTVDWGSSGGFTVTLDDASGTQLTQLTGSSSQFGSGGIGFLADIDPSFVNYWDGIQIL